MHWAIPAVWPDLPRFIQKSLNTEAKGQVGEAEVMRGMSQLVEASGPEGPDWEMIEEDARSSLPSCASYVHILAKYVQMNSGGPGGPLIRDLDDFCTNFVPETDGGARRLLGGEFINTVVLLNWKPDTVPYFVNAILKTNLIGPKVVDGICKLLNPSLVRKLVGKEARQGVITAEKLMGQARELCTKLNVDEIVRTQHIGLLDIRCVLFLLGKGKDVETTEFESIDDIARALVI